MVWVRRALSVVVALPGVLFITLGLRWLVDPAGVAPSLGMSLETGFGLSSQVGDLSAFFLVTGLCIVTAVVTRIRTWFYPPMMLLAIAATGRLVAWIIHDAAFVPQAIGVELGVTTLLVVASLVLPRRD